MIYPSCLPVNSINKMNHQGGGAWGDALGAFLYGRCTQWQNVVANTVAVVRACRRAAREPIRRLCACCSRRRPPPLSLRAGSRGRRASLRAGPWGCRRLLACDAAPPCASLPPLPRVRRLRSRFFDWGNADSHMWLTDLVKSGVWW
jgi:hypothetical protein